MKQPIDIELSDRLDGVGEYYFSRKLREIDAMRAAGRRIISLGIGSPDRPPHESVVARLHESASRPDTHAYQSYKGAAVLRRAFSAWYADRYGVRLDPDREILPLIGSKEGLMHICMTYLRRGDKVLVPNPGYPTYRSAVTLAGGEPVEYRLSADGGWLPDWERIERSGLERVKMMILNYPQMPTGAVPTDDLFARAVEFALKHSILLVHDNPYSFVRNPRPSSLLAADGAKECALELNSLSKSHNMAGWRIGMIGGRAEWIDQILRFKSNMDSGQFLPMQEAAAVALSLGDEWYRRLNDEYYAREEYGYRLLDALGCTYRKGQAGLFIWAELPSDFEGDCYAFSDRVLDRCGVFVTPGGIFGSEGGRYVRISLCASREMLAEAIEAVENNFGL